MTCFAVPWGLLALAIVLLLACPSAMAAADAPTFVADGPNPVAFPAQEAKFIRVVILASSGGQPCIDELEIYGPDGQKNLALAAGGAKATASSCLPGYADPPGRPPQRRALRQ